MHEKVCPQVSGNGHLRPGLFKHSNIKKNKNSHNHTPNLWKEAARAKKKKLIMAAATMGSCKRTKVINRVMTNILQSAMPEAQAELRKLPGLGQAIQCERKKVPGISGTVPKTLEDIMEKLPD
jgi:hypothetical protein